MRIYLKYFIERWSKIINIYVEFLFKFTFKIYLVDTECDVLAFIYKVLLLFPRRVKSSVQLI